MKALFLAAGLSAAATFALAETQTYTIDPTHADAVFTYDHIGMSTSTWVIGGFTGEIVIDRDNLAESSITVTVPAANLFTGDESRIGHIVKSGEFFDITSFPDATFSSTSVEVTGEDTAKVTGDITINGVTQSIVLDAVLNGEMAEYPIPPFNGKPAIGFSATGSFKRSAFNLGKFAPFISDDITMVINVEAMDLS
ncbi:MAG: YceI family protein [Pseudomonadota bacterium]